MLSLRCSSFVGIARLPGVSDLGGADRAERPVDGLPDHQDLARLDVFRGDRVAARDAAALRPAAAGVGGGR